MNEAQALQIVQSLAVDRPRALMVTNNADTTDDDETLIVAHYFGSPVPGGEASDDGRIGQRQVMRRNLAGDRQSFFLGSPHKFN